MGTNIAEIFSPFYRGLNSDLEVRRASPLLHGNAYVEIWLEMVVEKKRAQDL